AFRRVTNVTLILETWNMPTPLATSSKTVWMVTSPSNIWGINTIKNFGNTMEADQNNNISLKVIYFLDYLQLKKKKTKN
ncbi:MAG TPA: DUF5916 domain-containing protein, partial [Chitinophagaceae bacterium]|nr:DUF5916 domain-containing protein [Chitinophagaceae bacterium]